MAFLQCLIKKVYEQAPPFEYYKYGFMYFLHDQQMASSKKKLYAVITFVTSSLVSFF